MDDPYKYERLLIAELKKIHNDKGFILGVLSDAKTEENFRHMKNTGKKRI